VCVSVCVSLPPRCAGGSLSQCFCASLSVGVCVLLSVCMFLSLNVLLPQCCVSLSSVRVYLRTKYVTKSVASRAIEGRLWGASAELKNLKCCVIAGSTRVQNAVEMIAKHGSVDVYELDYATVYKWDSNVKLPFFSKYLGERSDNYYQEIFTTLYGGKKKPEKVDDKNAKQFIEQARKNASTARCLDYMKIESAADTDKRDMFSQLQKKMNENIDRLKKMNQFKLNFFKNESVTTVRDGIREMRCLIQEQKEILALLHDSLLILQ